MPEVALTAEIEANGLRVVDIPRRGRNARTGAKESQVSLILAERSGSSVERPARTTSPITDERRVRATIQREFAKVALFPSRRHPWPVGRAHAVAVGYPPELLSAVPARSLESFCGIAWPFDALALRPGDVVVDVGAGSGTDARLAAHYVGDAGQVVGVEMTEELLRKAAPTAHRRPSTTPRFEKGVAEDLPLPEGFADAVVANAVVNLFVVDKERVLAEIWRILKPGGRLVLADAVVDTVAPPEDRAVPERWATGLAGPVSQNELLDMLRVAGFVGVAVRGRSDPFADAKLAETVGAAGRSGILVTAEKPR